MRRLVLAALLVFSSAALAGCSPSTVDSSSPEPVPTTASPSSSDGPSETPQSGTPQSGTSSSGTPAATANAADGAITFTGALSGTMTISACHDGMAQLVVAVTGESQTYAGLIDADDFTFAVPHSTGYTLADGASKPVVSGNTYTVKNTELVSMTDDDTVTATGSVTCP